MTPQLIEAIHQRIAEGLEYLLEANLMDELTPEKDDSMGIQDELSFCF